MTYDQDNDEPLTNRDLRELLERYPLVKGDTKLVLSVNGECYFVRSHMVSMGPEQELILYAEDEPF